MMRGKNALVTGATAGIGRELARQLVRERGMRVLATGRRRERLDSLAAELPAGSVEVMAGDLADAGFRAALWERAEAMPGGCDLLVNNAGLGHYSLLAEQDFEKVRQMVEVNVMALIDLTQRAARSMKARGGGQILEISSVLGYMGLPYSAVYVATKHAVNGLVKSLRYELRGTGVRVWAACPARTESEFQAVAIGQEGSSVEGHQRLGTYESTEKVVRGILKGLDRSKGFWMPSWMAAGVVWLEWLLPGPFDWFMARWSPGYFGREVAEGRQHLETGGGER